MSQSTPDDTLALLTRLSRKPGVQSTLILSRVTGAILRTSGLISAGDSDSADSNNWSIKNGDGGANGDTRRKIAEEGEGRQGRGLKSAEDVARLVWGFFGAAGGMVEEMMGEKDEVRLLRVRTRRNEVVIYPDAKFLLVVVHDTPPA